MPSHSGLATVQRLYLMQIELLDLLADGLRDPDARKKARECVREFSSLLRQADPSYMGGEDVLASLRRIEQKVSEKLRSPVAKRIRKKPPRKLHRRN